MNTYISVEEARRTVLAHVRQTQAEQLAFEASLGRTLAEAVVSRDTIPPFDNSAMDGYAVRTEDVADVPVRLEVAFEVAAGTAPQQRVEAGTCARIMTGAPVPEGADAVVPVEWTEEEADRVRFDRAPALAANIRRAGEDVQEDQELLPAGQVVTPPMIGLLATLGQTQVAVRRKPRVAVVATGDELVDAAETPGPGQIRDSNGPALAAQVRSADGEPVGPLRAPDEAAAIRAVLKEALAADVLVIAGGVSVGKYDLVKEVLDRMGLELLFWKVRQRPGKPLAFGLLEGKPVFGLPGNPVSAMVCFEAYVRPALAKMLGRREVARPRFTATLSEAMRSKEGLHYLARGVAREEEGRLRVRPAGAQGSHVSSAMAAANCLIHLPEDLVDPQAGVAVEIEWLG